MYNNKEDIPNVISSLSYLRTERDLGGEGHNEVADDERHWIEVVIEIELVVEFHDPNVASIIT